MSLRSNWRCRALLRRACRHLCVGCLPLAVACQERRGPEQQAPPPHIAAPSTTPSPSPVAEHPPPSFAAGRPISVANAGVAGCDSRALDGWLELKCRAYNPVGGKIVEAEVHEAPASTQKVLPESDGQLRVVLPWRSRHETTARIKWSDASYELQVDGQTGAMRRVETDAVRQACQALEQRHDTFLKEVRAGSGAVTRDDVRRFPRFGRCVPAGQGAWALAARKVSASGEGAKREVVAELEVVHVDEAGALHSFPFAVLPFTPGGLSVPPLMVYDYDADAVPEVIIRYDVLRRPEGRRTSPLGAQPAVFTWSGNRVTAYGPAGKLGGGAVLVEHLDRDMRPDVGHYGPFLAWVGKECGVGSCPRRLVGPRFFSVSLPDGGFDAGDERATQVLSRSCSSASGAVVPESLSSVADKQRLALNVACSVLRGASGGDVSRELKAGREKLCGAASECELLSTLLGWAKSTPPRTLRP